MLMSPSRSRARPSSSGTVPLKWSQAEGGGLLDVCICRSPYITSLSCLYLQISTTPLHCDLYLHTCHFSSEKAARQLLDQSLLPRNIILGPCTRSYEYRTSSPTRCNEATLACSNDCVPSPSSIKPLPVSQPKFDSTRMPMLEIPKPSR